MISVSSMRWRRILAGRSRCPLSAAHPPSPSGRGQNSREMSHVIQAEEQSEWKFGAAGPECPAIVFISASAEDARAFRAIVASRWLVVNVPDLAGAQAVIDKLRPALVVCDTEIEGRGTWRDLLPAQDACPSFALIVASRQTDAALWAEVFNLGGSDVLDKPFAVDEVDRAIDRGFHAVCGKRGEGMSQVTRRFSNAFPRS